ncbi:hypothetical protein MKEN_00031100 [Mycena kentingensis (nom. inval.)]|nr:hypothetical protein MKEN_00031100 [Mycena kentingensis (nom. inval.)]
MSTIVFLGAPPPSELQRSPKEYEWRVASTSSRMMPPPPLPAARHQPPQILFSQPEHASTLATVSRRISLMYENVIFNDAEEIDEKESRRETFINWSAAGEDSQDSQSQDGGGNIPSFLNVSQSVVHPAAPTARSGAFPESQWNTQMFAETLNLSDSGDNLGASDSIARFPEFHLSLNALTPLAALANAPGKGSTKASFLLAVLEVDGPDTITFKKGKDAGKESFVLKMILGDEEGNVCKLTAWREVAQDWGGCGEQTAAKRGDVILLTDVMAAYEPATAVTLTASPWQKPKMEICYRTMPYTHEDRRLRPDLRLGASDASVRKVAAVVRWFEGMAGLN